MEQIIGKKMCCLVYEDNHVLIEFSMRRPWRTADVTGLSHRIKDIALYDSPSGIK
jgi:hypothetical protein